MATINTTDATTINTTEPTAPPMPIAGVKLTAKHFAGNGAHISPDWVSNGHWAVKLTCVINAQLFDRCETARAAFPQLPDARPIETDRIDRMLPGADVQAFTVQPWIYVSTSRSGYGRRAKLVNHDLYLLTAPSGDVAYMTRDYLQLFGLEPGAKLFGTDASSPMRSAAGDFLIMPFRASANDGADPIAPIASVVRLQDLRADRAA